MKKIDLSEVRAIFGIGNPGTRYRFNRHNAGFLFLDYLSKKYSVSFSPSREDYCFAEGKFNNTEFCLVKPTTYVNNSGIAAMQVISRYNLELKDFLVVLDDINLSNAAFRVRKSGGDGGHNGLRSIIFHVQSEDFPRIRFGVGSKSFDGDLVDYVLGDFTAEEMMQMLKSFDTVTNLVTEFISSGIQGMMDANSRISNSNQTENSINLD
jgi:PTH1 family peptidyl-tRNA hydrolase